MLATEQPTPPPLEAATHATLLETHAQNERMRHIPTLEWMVRKLDGDVRRRIEKLWLPYSDLPASDARHPALEAGFRALCRSLDRVADVARHHHGKQHAPNDLGSRITWSVQHAIQNLNSAEGETFGRRYPFQTFERSNGEPLWAALLTAIQHVQRLTDLVREIEPDIDERLYEELVQLQEPLRREPMA